MILRIFLFILFGIISAFLGQIANAAPIYTPWHSIIMTGATASARFDVAEALFNSGMTGKEPKLETVTKTFTGVFYLNSIGWVDFSTGSYQVGLDCGVQSLSGLTTNCHFTGTGWSEIVGDVEFSSVEYIPSLGELSGSVSTLAGDVSLSGIYLPLRASTFNEDITHLTATSALTLSISGAVKYGNSGWWITYSPKLATESRSIPGSPSGIFSGDLTFADDYTIIITDPSGSTTQLDAIISPNVLSTTLDGSSNFIHDFCTFHTSSCPDGATLSATTIVNSGSSIVADGASHYQVRIKIRDTYGNRVNGGTMEIGYTGTVSSVQIPIDTMGPITWVGLKGDALIFSGETFSLDPINGIWNTPMPITLLGNDITYNIASVAPTNGTDNTLVLNTISYTSPLGTVSTLTDVTSIEFLPAFKTDITGPAVIHVGEENSFENTVIKNTARFITPNILSLLIAGSGTNAAFRDFSTQDITCQAYPQDTLLYTGNCDWQQLSNIFFPSVVTAFTGTSFTFTGTYAPFTAYPSPENVSYSTFVHYTKAILGNPLNYIGSDNIVYLDVSGTLGTSEYQASTVKLIGQNNARGEYGTIGTNKTIRAKLIDTIRKNSMMLSRNRNNDYGGADYIIQNGGTFTVTGGTLDDKRAIVIIGGDIIISTNVTNAITNNHPVAIIALADNEGNGGNIIINGSVTDINASLIAEHSILNSGAKDYQLYIHGSIISANTLGDTAAQICPYYVTAACNQSEAAKYDFEMMRSDYDGLTVSKRAINPSAITYGTTPFIVEYDTRLQGDPPPILQ